MQKSVIAIILFVAVVVVVGIFFFSNPYKTSFTGNIVQTGIQVQNSGGTTQYVDISSFSFQPSSFTINVGDTVVWTNMDNVFNTVTSDMGTELSSSDIAPGYTYSHTFTTAGTYPYHSRINPSMTGKVIVQ